MIEKKKGEKLNGFEGSNQQKSLGRSCLGDNW